MCLSFSQKAHALLEQLQKLDFDEIEAIEIQHWAGALKCQTQIGQINPYAQTPRNFFSAKSECKF